MDKVLVSVVVATYCRDITLIRALNSLVKQTYKNIEIVVVDDNDNLDMNSKVKNIVDDCMLEHADISIKYVCNSRNLGSAKSRNIGIDNCEGSYICFLDDDDIYLPEKIEQQLCGMLESNADCSITDLVLYDKKEKLVYCRKRGNFFHNRNDLIKYHLMHHITGTDTIMFKKDYLIKIGCFDEIDVGDEFYLMQKAIENGGLIVHIPRCDVKAYIHHDDNGLSIGQGRINGEKVLYEYKKKYFDILNAKEIRHIKMRHHAVLALTYIRDRRYIRGLCETFISAASAPISAIKMFFEMYGCRL